MTFNDVLQLMALYLGLFATLFGIPWAAIYMWQQFKAFASPNFNSND